MLPQIKHKRAARTAKVQGQCSSEVAGQGQSQTIHHSHSAQQPPSGQDDHERCSHEATLHSGQRRHLLVHRMRCLCRISTQAASKELQDEEPGQVEGGRYARPTQSPPFRTAPENSPANLKTDVAKQVEGEGQQTGPAQPSNRSMEGKRKRRLADPENTQISRRRHCPHSSLSPKRSGGHRSRQAQSAAEGSREAGGGGERNSGICGQEAE